jgi:hypothetical protein
MLAYLLIFRYDITFFYSTTNEINYFWLLISDLLAYLTLVIFSIILNLYLLITSSPAKELKSLAGLLGINKHAPKDTYASYRNEVFSPTDLE